MDLDMEIYNYVKSIYIIDTHEHLPPWENARERDTDFIIENLSNYLNCDLISAGLLQADYEKVIDHRIPISKRWNIVQPHWENVRLTGYGQALEISVKELYGIEHINSSTIEELNERFLESLKPGHFRKVLQKKSKIRVCLLDNKEGLVLGKENLGCDPSLFSPVYRLDHFIFPRMLDDIKSVEKELNFDICSLDNWFEACEQSFHRAFLNGAVALKCALAYVRPLQFERSSRSQAEKEFNKILENRYIPEWRQAPLCPSKHFQDYMMHFLLGLSNTKGIIMQFHTGLQNGHGNIITHSNPVQLSNLFFMYPKVIFDIFHIGYPYQMELAVLAKTFPNVFIDMCWAHIISPTSSIRALIEFLETVPCNKISAFGGDYKCIDGVYGHQYLARLNVSRALSNKINKGLLTIEQAKKIARMLFYENPKRIFNLEGKL